jgi:hypothetical protein
MKNKVLAAEEALTGVGGTPVPRVIIGSANGENAIARARAGEGTLFEGASVGARAGASA